VTQANVEIVRASLEAFNRQDLDGVLKDSAPDAVLDWSRAIGPYRGVYEVADFGRFLDDFSGTFESVRIEPEEYILAGEQVVVSWTLHFRGRDGIEATAKGSMLWTVRDGRTTRVCLYQERDEALEAARLSE
jgi:ketosteroid isomerase-like protein